MCHLGPATRHRMSHLTIPPRFGRDSGYYAEPSTISLRSKALPYLSHCSAKCCSVLASPTRISCSRATTSDHHLPTLFDSRFHLPLRGKLQQHRSQLFHDHWGEHPEACEHELRLSSVRACLCAHRCLWLALPSHAKLQSHASGYPARNAARRTLTKKATDAYQKAAFQYARDRPDQPQLRTLPADAVLLPLEPARCWIRRIHGNGAM
mmetsp:Transcript_42417/g.137121  ORF Transcript_42417/g.137121 Transcript_42417/m.137121 type:complete len:208 (-) Transcript_42417:3207-3830(-)